MNEHTLRRVFRADVIGMCLVLIAIQVLLYGVGTVIRESESHTLFWICMMAAAISFFGAHSRWKVRQLSAALITLGIIAVWIAGAGITGPIVDLIRGLIAAGPQLFPQINYRFETNVPNVVMLWTAIGDSSAALATRLQASIYDGVEARRLSDVLITNMFWMFALWLLSAWMGWFAARRNGMASLLPGVMLLTYLVSATERRAESLWAFVMIMLLLMGIWNFKNHIQHWEIHHIDYSDSIRFDSSQFILLVVAVVGLASYITPSISWRDIRDYLRERQQPQQIETLTRPSSDANTTTQSSQRAHTSSLPREHLLTAGSAQSTEMVMTIKTGELSPVPLQSVSANAPRYYWRSVVYDQYDGRGWFTTSAPPQSISANQTLVAGLLTRHKSLHLDVQMQQPDGRLYWSGVLYSAGVPLAVDWRLRPQSSLFADQTDLLQADMFAARTEATSYAAESLVPTPSIEQLRAASSDEYPEHILRLYFSLPETLPKRVHDLAKEITDGQATPFDKAKAIEAYLRATYPYDLNIPAPPEDQDVTDYFLFDLKRGYCDYYATAMVVLARSSGIPARFVSGYAPGDYDAANAQYVVRELHAHSWAEAYFPGIGWVEFEPTGNQPEIERHASNESAGKTHSEDAVTRPVFGMPISWSVGGLFIPVVIVFFAILIYAAIIERLKLMRMTPHAAIEVLYRRLYRSGRPLAGAPTHAETAHEFTNNLIQTIRAINLDSRDASHDLQSDITDLATIYQSALFSEHRADQQHVKHALMIWKRLRWSLIRERIKYFFWKQNKFPR